MYRFSFIGIFILVACSTTHIHSQKETNQPQIAFYFLEAAKSKDNKIQVKLNKTKVTNGKLKTYMQKIIPYQALKNGYWRVNFNNRTTVFQIQIPNPLEEKIEYIDSLGQLSTRTIYHKNKIFVLRVPYDDSIKTLTFEQLSKDSTGVKTHRIDSVKL